MSLPATICATVDPAAVTKVTRLFNNGLQDILHELIQNARRAGATAVHLSVLDHAGGPRLLVRDDGAGIADPSVVLALGRSDWDDETRRREDPAGMGVFSLAGRNVRITSRVTEAASGWTIAIGEDDWESGAPIAVEACDHARGTDILFGLDGKWAESLAGVARTAALYCPIPVSFNGTQLDQQDWLTGAAAVIARGGVRIGVFEDSRPILRANSINFHGVTVPGGLPGIAEGDRQWSVRVDIVDAPDLQLVLPARKEMVQNAALDLLRVDALRAIYEHIATLDAHRLSFGRWKAARDMGIRLPEAVAELRSWTPATNDAHIGEPFKILTDLTDLVVIESSTPALEQCAAFAIERAGTFPAGLANPNDAMIGYGWYDRLPRITDIAFEIERDGRTALRDMSANPDLETGVVDRLDLLLTVSSDDADLIRVPAPIVLIYDDEGYWSMEESAILLAQPDAVSATELVDLLEAICFSSSDDRDADSWDTQHDYFLRNAREFAVRTLQGDDAALIERVRALLADKVQWFMPEGRALTVRIARDVLDIALSDPA